MAKKVTLTVNGRRHTVKSAPDTKLLTVLREELGLQGPRFGCGLSQCGACTVHVEGEAVRACIVPATAVAGKKVTTLEGLGADHPVLEAFVEERAAQCGYCINGMVMQSIVFLKKTPRPTEAQIKKALNANICRCGTHYAIVKAVKRASRAAA
jgi:nicotinate dehydrogenase subunit A